MDMMKFRSNLKPKKRALEIEPFLSDSPELKELERLFKIDDDIIRYLTTKVSEISDEPSDIIKDKLDKEENEKDSFKNYDNSDKNRDSLSSSKLI